MANQFTDLFKQADDAFNGKYASELSELTGLSASEIQAIEPGTNSQKTYLALIKVVEQASKENLSQAELIDKIKELGHTAVSIAKKVSGFGQLL